MLSPNVLMISGMMMPTESVVMANIMNIRKVSALIAPVSSAGFSWPVESSLSLPRCDLSQRHRLLARWIGIGNDRTARSEIDFEPGPFGISFAIPGRANVVIAAQLKIAAERRMRVPEADQIEQRAHNGNAKLVFHFVSRVVVPVNVAAHAGSAQQI